MTKITYQPAGLSSRSGDLLANVEARLSLSKGEIRPLKGESLMVGSGQYQLVIGEHELLIRVAKFRSNSRGYLASADFTVIV